MTNPHEPREIERREPTEIELHALDALGRQQNNLAKLTATLEHLRHKAQTTQAAADKKQREVNSVRRLINSIHALAHELRPECDDCNTAACYEALADDGLGLNLWCEECVPESVDHEAQDQPEHAHHDELDNVTRPGCDA